MGISVALSPATTTVTMSKSMITNASFRTKKLPGEFDSLECSLSLVRATTTLEYLVVQSIQLYAIEPGDLWVAKTPFLAFWVVGFGRMPLAFPI